MTTSAWRSMAIGGRPENVVSVSLHRELYIVKLERRPPPFSAGEGGTDERRRGFGAGRSRADRRPRRWTRHLGRVLRYRRHWTGACGGSQPLLRAACRRRGV